MQGEEGHLLPEAAVAHDRRGPRDELRGQPARKVVFQTGSQQRSDHRFRRACELVRNGRIGDLRTVRVGLPGGRTDYAKTGDHKKPEPVPEGLRLQPLARPGARCPLCPARCHVNFRWIYDYSGGQVTDWGGHHPDCAQWGMGTELTGPVEIRNAKGVFPPDELWNTATEYSFEAVYENGVTMIISNKEKMGVTFEGTKGKIYVNRGKLEAEPKSLLDSKIGPERDSPLQERRPLPQLHRLRDLARADGRAGRGRPPLDHDLPPGQHRHAAEPRKAALGPADRADHRRRRGSQDAEPALSCSVGVGRDLIEISWTSGPRSSAGHESEVVNMNMNCALHRRS